jgi:hypothetical protein
MAINQIATKTITIAITLPRLLFVISKSLQHRHHRITQRRLRRIAILVLSSIEGIN